MGEGGYRQQVAPGWAGVVVVVVWDFLVTAYCRQSPYQNDGI